MITMPTSTRSVSTSFPTTRAIRCSARLFASLAATSLLLASPLMTGCATSSATSTNDAAAATSTTGAGAETEAMLLDGDRVALLWVNGMGCPLCANNVDRQLRRLDGVERVTVDLGTGLITAHLTEGARPSRQQLERAVTNSGFTLVRAEVSP